MAGSVCPVIGIPCSLATAFIENDRAQTSVNDFTLMFILVIGFTWMEETSAIVTTLQLQDSSARILRPAKLPGRRSRFLPQIWPRCPEAEFKRADIDARYRPAEEAIAGLDHVIGDAPSREGSRPRRALR
jgi:hypothetical protein